MELQVICAFRRLGTMFGCEKYNIKPDLVTLAKVRSLLPLEYLHVANADDTMLLCFGRFYSCELSFLLHAVQQLSSGYMPISAVPLGQHMFLTSGVIESIFPTLVAPNMVKDKSEKLLLLVLRTVAVIKDAVSDDWVFEAGEE
jgi:hypothetical protein